MPLLDDQGRLFGRINLLDAFLAILLIACIVTAYVTLSSPYRVAAPYALESNSAWITVHIQLPPESDWLLEHAKPGLQQYDQRSGKPVAEIISVQHDQNGAAVIATLHAAGDAEGRYLFGNAVLVPGETIRITTSACVIEGRITKVGHPTKGPP